MFCYNSLLSFVSLDPAPERCFAFCVPGRLWHVLEADLPRSGAGHRENLPCPPQGLNFAKAQADAYSRACATWFEGVKRSLVGYFLKTRGGPLTRLTLRSTLTSTRSAILMKGIPLFIPYSLRSKAIVPTIAPDPVPSPETVSVNFSERVTPRIVKLPSTSKVLGLVGTREGHTVGCLRHWPGFDLRDLPHLRNQNSCGLHDFGLHDNAASADWPAGPRLSRLCVGASTFVWRRNILLGLAGFSAVGFVDQCFDSRALRPQLCRRARSQRVWLSDS